MAESNNPTQELFGQATRSFEAAIQSGIKLQEETVKFVTEMVHEMASPEKWQAKTQAAVGKLVADSHKNLDEAVKKSQSVMTEMVATSQKNIDEAVQAINENAKTSLDLLQKAFEAPPTNVEEAQNKALTLWETALGAMRKNTESMLKANSRFVEAWTEAAQTVNGQQMEKMAELAQKAAEAAKEFGREAMAGAKA